MVRRHWQVGASAAAVVVALLLWSGAYAPRKQPFVEPLTFWALQGALGGSAWVISGVILLGRPSSRRLAWLLTATGIAIWISRLIDSRVAELFTIGLNLQFLVGPLAVITLLAYPSGELRGWDRLVGAAVAVAGAAHVAVGVFYDPALHWCLTCPPDMNLLLVAARPGLIDALYPWFIGAYGLAYGYAAVVLCVRWIRASPLARRVRSPMVIPAVAYSGIAGLFFAYEVSVELDLLVPPIPLVEIGGVAWVAQLLVPVMFLVGLARSHTSRGRVADLVTELSESAPSDRLEAALRRTLRDPSLEVGYWSADAEAYLTADGAPVDIDTTARGVTLIRGDHGPLGVLLHEPALSEDGRLLDATTAAAKLAVENAQLAAQLRHQLAEVRASRSRIVQAGDAARRRVERDLHDGAQQRLVSLALQLRQLRSRANGSADELDGALRELEIAMRELRELARGVYPLALAEGGLAAALDSVAERAALPTTIELAPPSRLPEAVEVAAYFVVSEAVTNAAKHAGAQRVSIRAETRDERLLVEVRDDGVGGAMTRPGGGLSGLIDRVEALDGTLTVLSSPGTGTTVRAELPCASS